jgi:hypothetical protein
MALDLLVICVSAFFAVFVLLSFLAVVIRLLTLACPQKVSAGSDTAVIAAVSTAVSVLYPGTMVTKVEEI